MKISSFLACGKGLVAWAVLFGFSVAGMAQTATITLSRESKSATISPNFLGLSYESRIMLPVDGKYYFDARDANLVRVFRTLGIKNLRVGANAVDDPKVPVPDTKDIDALFKFARQAGVKVIYSFRLKNGDPANSARLAAYIAKHYSDCLDCFCVGNEPNFYLKTSAALAAALKPQYAAILKAVPDAMFDGPAAFGKEYTLSFADTFYPGGHIALVSAHAYPLGNGRVAEKNLTAARRRFVSNRIHRDYQKLYDEIVVPLADKKIPFRLDETNSCYHGGAKGASDTYASTLWGLDYINWWAAHHILGMNFHTGDTVNGIPPMAANYAAFVHLTNSKDFDVRPLAYAMLAFSQSAHGTPMEAKVDAPPKLNFAAYAYQDGSTIDVIALNKSYGGAGQPLKVRLTLPANAGPGRWQRMDLDQKAGDVAAKSDIELGGAAIDSHAHWDGKWENLPGSSELTFTIKPASAALLKFSPAG